MKKPSVKIIRALTAITLLLTSLTSQADPIKILNVSYDPTREFYEEYNKLFATHWKTLKQQDIEVQQSHGGSGKQARSVIDGVEADVVTLALAYDIDAIVENAKLLPANWQTKLPHNSSPYTSTMVFLVRKDNPKKILDWNDLTRSDVQVITPNPKTSGGARWNYLAAWAFAIKKWNSPEKAKEFITAIFKNVPVLDSGARGSTTTFAQRGLGDVLITWENEAHLALKEFGADKFEIVIPSLSILAEPTVAVIDTIVDKKSTRPIAEEYLKYLYSPEAQRLASKHHFRPVNPEILKELEGTLPKLQLVQLNELYKSWSEVQQIHFSDGGIFDQIYLK